MNSLDHLSPSFLVSGYLYILCCCSVIQLCPTLCTPMDCSQASLSFTVSWSLLKPCPLSQWCHPTISSSVSPLYSWPQSFPASGSFPVSWLCSGGQSIYRSFRFSINRSVNIQGWFPLGLTGLISLMSSGLLRVLSNTRVQKHQFFDAQLSL